MIKVDQILDAKGLACPMPIVKTKRAMETLNPGQVIEVQATDRGSLSDMQSWAKTTGHQYLGTTEEGDVLKHYLRKASSTEEMKEQRYSKVINNDTLVKQMNDENAVIIDVREPAEYAFQHIPGSLSVPLGDIEKHSKLLRKDKTIYVICRTGNRSDLACQELEKQGFVNLYNVVPGMSEWVGPTEKSE